MKIGYFLFIALFLCACTLNITLTSTHGYADDVVDTKTDQDVSPELSATIPVKGL